MKTAYCYTVWFSRKITFKPREPLWLRGERTECNHASFVGTSWHTTSIKRMPYCLLTLGVTVHSGFTVYHISKWTGYEVHLNLLPFPFPAETIMAHLSSSRGSELSSNCLAFGVLGVIVSYEIRYLLALWIDTVCVVFGFYCTWTNIVATLFVNVFIYECIIKSEYFCAAVSFQQFKTLINRHEVEISQQPWPCSNTLCL